MSLNFPLLEHLPPELRLEIYRYYIHNLLHTPPTPPLTSSSLDSDPSNPHRLIHDSPSTIPPSNPLFHLSASLASELGSLIYPHYTFLVSTPQTTRSSARHFTLHPSSGFKLSQVQHLTLKIDPKFSPYRLFKPATYLPRDAQLLRSRLHGDLQTLRVIIVLTTLSQYWKCEPRLFIDLVIGYLDAFSGVRRREVVFLGGRGDGLFDLVAMGVEDRLKGSGWRCWGRRFGSGLTSVERGRTEENLAEWEREEVYWRIPLE